MQDPKPPRKLNDALRAFMAAAPRPAARISTKTVKELEDDLRKKALVAAHASLDDAKDPKDRNAAIDRAVALLRAGREEGGPQAAQVSVTVELAPDADDDRDEPDDEERAAIQTQ